MLVPGGKQLTLLLFERSVSKNHVWTCKKCETTASQKLGDTYMSSDIDSHHMKKSMGSVFLKPVA